MRLGDLFQVRRDGGPVEVVAAALALGLEDVFLAGSWVGRQAAGGLAGWGGGVHGIDVCEGAPEGREGCWVGRGGDEALEGWGGGGLGVGEGGGGDGLGGREDLLDFFHACELGKHGGASDGGGAFNLVAGFPGGGGGVVAWAVARAQVGDGDLERDGGVVREAVEELSARGGRGDGGVGEDLGEGEAEDGDRVGFQGVFQVALVKDVALAVLDEEDDAGGVSEGGFTVGVEGSSKAGCQAFCALVGGEFEGTLRDWLLQEGIFGMSEMPGGFVNI